MMQKWFNLQFRYTRLRENDRESRDPTVTSRWCCAVRHCMYTASWDNSVRYELLHGDVILWIYSLRPYSSAAIPNFLEWWWWTPGWSRCASCILCKKNVEGEPLLDDVYRRRSWKSQTRYGIRFSTVLRRWYARIQHAQPPGLTLNSLSNFSNKINTRTLTRLPLRPIPHILHGDEFSGLQKILLP